MHLPYEKAIGIGWVIPPMQMTIIPMDAWPPDQRRDFNVDELLWKELIEPGPETISGCRLTERGERVRVALMLKETGDGTCPPTRPRLSGGRTTAVSPTAIRRSR